MKTSNAQAQWKGKINDGRGTMKFTGFEGGYAFGLTAKKEGDTNPEELVGAAIAGCYAMILSLLLTEEGLNPESIDTTAKVSLGQDDSGPLISEIKLDCKVKCHGLDESKLKELALGTEKKCPVSRLYAGGTAKILFSAQLIK